MRGTLADRGPAPDIARLPTVLAGVEYRVRAEVSALSGRWQGAPVVPWLTRDEAGPESGHWVGAIGVGRWGLDSLPGVGATAAFPSIAAYLDADPLTRRGPTCRRSPGPPCSASRSSTPRALRPVVGVEQSY